MHLVASFKLLSVTPTSQSTKHLHITQTHTNDYVIAITLPDRVCFRNVSDLEPRKSPGFPPDQDLATSLKRQCSLDDDDDDELPPVRAQNHQSIPLHTWKEIAVPNLIGNSLQACTMGFYGSLLCILDNKGRVWIWRNTTE